MRSSAEYANLCEHEKYVWVAYTITSKKTKQNKNKGKVQERHDEVSIFPIITFIIDNVSLQM